MNDGGLVRVCTLEETNEPGFMPVEKLVEQKRYFAGKVQTGITRMYAAAGANEQYDLVIQCFNALGDFPERAKYVLDERGAQYQINHKREIYKSDAMELTLTKVEDYYDVAT